MGLLVPGMESSVVGDPLWAESVRAGPNAWAATTLIAPAHRTAALDRLVTTTSPARVLAELGTGRTSGTVLRVELDTCGAWVTIASAGGPRPIVLRRAGWLDVRGHAGPVDDRVGVGPGDALVLVGAGVADRTAVNGERFGDEALPDLLLRCAGASAADVAFQAWSGAQRLEPAVGGPEAVAVLRVPDDLGDDPLQRIVDATGVPAAELELPGYPLGDAQPDLWKLPPAPPREARLLLPPDAARLADIRALLARLLASWRLDALLEDGDITLLATEVASNAVRHAGTEAVVVVRYLGDRVRIEVGDASPTLPRPQRPDPHEPGGRGMLLVDELSSSWGVERTRRGKRVWFEVPAGTG